MLYQPSGVGKGKMQVLRSGEMTLTPPEYILVTPQKDDVPRMEASCDGQDIDDLREIQLKGQSIYKLVRGYEK